MPNVNYVYIKINTFRNALNQIHANLMQNHFPPNIVDSKYDTFTLIEMNRRNISWWGGSWKPRKTFLHMNKSNQEFFRISVWHGVPLSPWRVHWGFWCRADSWSSSTPEWCCWSHDSSLYAFFLCPWCLYEFDHKFYRRKGSFKSTS